ncbi:MAG: hypothetical protein ACPG5T_09435, partial [Endozoicomonas sp.]
MNEAGLSTQLSAALPARNADTSQNMQADRPFAGMKTGAVTTTVLQFHLPVSIRRDYQAVRITFRVVTVHIAQPLLRLDERIPAPLEGPEGKEIRPDSSSNPVAPDSPKSPGNSGNSGEPGSGGCSLELSDDLHWIEENFCSDNGAERSERLRDKGLDPSIGKEDARQHGITDCSIDGRIGEIVEGDQPARQPGASSSGGKQGPSEQLSNALSRQLPTSNELTSLVNRGIALFKSMLQLTTSASPVSGGHSGSQLQAEKSGLPLRSDSGQPVSSASGEKLAPQPLSNVSNAQLSPAMSGQPVLMDSGVRVPSQVIPLEPSKLRGREGSLRKKEKGKKDKWKKDRQGRNHPGDK